MSNNRDLNLQQQEYYPINLFSSIKNGQRSNPESTQFLKVINVNGVSILPDKSQLTSSNGVSREALILEGKNARYRKRISIILQSRPFEYFIISLIGIYCALVIVNFAISDFASNTDFQSNVGNAQTALLYIELVILIFFILEIILNTYVFGFKLYFRDKWMFADAFVIFGSFCLVIMDLRIESDSFSSIARVIRGIMRFLRIFLLFRKMKQFKKKVVTNMKGRIKSPIETVLETLTTSKKMTTEKDLIREIDWCIEIISTNKLYTPLVDDMNTENKTKIDQMNLWIQNFSKKSFTNDKIEKGRMKASKSKKLDYSIRSTDDMNPELGPPENIKAALINSEELSFDPFKLMVEGGPDALSYLVSKFFTENELFEEAKVDKQTLWEFARKVQAGYQPNPYHNGIHAIDVCQVPFIIIKTINFFLTKCNFEEIGELTSIEAAVMYVAGMIHDYEHPLTLN